MVIPTLDPPQQCYKGAVYNLQGWILGVLLWSHLALILQLEGCLGYVCLLIPLPHSQYIFLVGFVHGLAFILPTVYCKLEASLRIACCTSSPLQPC